MAEDKLKGREPGEDGTTVGQIQTPMCSENVGDKQGGSTHSYASVIKGANGDGGADIYGPGEQGNWDTQETIKGSNKPGKY